jgi:hypothetical protein
MQAQACEDFIAEITLGNARSSEIKDFIRKQAKRIREFETELALIDLKKSEKELRKKRAT